MFLDGGWLWDSDTFVQPIHLGNGFVFSLEPRRNEGVARLVGGSVGTWTVGKEW